MSDHSSGQIGSGHGSEHGSLLIDCDSCEMRNIACGDCVVTAILRLDAGAGSSHELEFDDSEARALTALAKGGLVPHLRLVDGRRRPA